MRNRRINFLLLFVLAFAALTGAFSGSAKAQGVKNAYYVYGGGTAAANGTYVELPLTTVNGNMAYENLLTGEYIYAASSFNGIAIVYYWAIGPTLGGSVDCDYVSTEVVQTSIYLSYIGPDYDPLVAQNGASPVPTILNLGNYGINVP